MKIEQNKVATIYYRLKDDRGIELENNYDSDPMAFLQGHGNIMPAIERAIEGLQTNDEQSVTLKPAEAYGERRANSAQKIPVKHILGKPKKLSAGQLVKVNTEKGAIDATVIKPGRFMVEIDFNHPFAGKTLTFEIKVVDVRDATNEEIAHGHAHGLGGYQH